MVGTVLFSCSSEESALSPELKACINNPECASSDGRLIIGYTPSTSKLDDSNVIEPVAMISVYEGDSIPDEFYDHWSC